MTIAEDTINIAPNEDKSDSLWREKMNHFYIEYMIKDQIRKEHEECQRRRLLKLDEGQDLPSKILESARIFFKHQGFENTRIVDICRNLGISRRTFHKCFNSLDEVLEVLWAR